MTEKSRVWHIVNNERNKFRHWSNAVMLQALRHQIAPVLEHARTIHDKKRLDSLISEQPVKEALHKIYFKVGAHFGKASFDALKKKRKKKDNADESFYYSFQDAVNDYIQSNGSKLVKSITNTTRDRLNNYLKEAEGEGWGIDKIATGMRQRFEELNASRALSISLTETNRASSWATVKGADLTGADYTKVWIQTPEASKVPREDHSDIEDAEKGEYFNVGGEQAMQPQDDSLSPEESINCHCTIQLVGKEVNTEED